MKDDGPLSKFYEIMKDQEYGQQFLKSLERVTSGTIFAPSNAAWQDDNIRNILLNNEKMREILDMHLVKDQRLSVEKIRQNINQQVKIIFPFSFHYFSLFARRNFLLHQISFFLSY